MIILQIISPLRSGVAQEGGGGGYHFASSARLPKLDSTLEILFVTACASQSAQTAQSEGDLLLVCRQKGTSPSSAGRRGGGSLVCYPTLGVRQTRQSDSHFRLVLGLPYTITINIPWSSLVIPGGSSSNSDRSRAFISSRIRTQGSHAATPS